MKNGDSAEPIPPIESSDSAIGLRVLSWTIGLVGLVGAVIWALANASTLGQFAIWYGVAIALGAFVWAGILGALASIAENSEITAKNSAISVKQMNRLINQGKVPEAPFKEV